MSSSLHAEWLVSLLQPTSREPFECVHVVTEVKLTLLSNSQSQGRHKLVADDVIEGGVTGNRVNQKFSIQ